jgi:lipopolysaccharide transport system ATP-binding protein
MTQPLIAISAHQLGKMYHIYRRPLDRLFQMIFRGTKKFYDEYWALQSVTIEVYRGETIGVIGRNGSGKSTFLQLVCGTLAPTSGSVRVNGRIAALLELGAGFNPEFTGRENVYLSASILGLTKEEIDARYEAITEFAGIGDFVNQPVKIYSSGMYARLAFAVAAHVDADILIVDEILAVGDAAFTQRCMRFIRNFKERGTILFVSHDTASVLNLCDRCIWLESGTVREIGLSKDVCHKYAAAIEGEKESTATFRIGGSRKEAPSALIKEHDHRKELIDSTSLKNEVKVFDFDPDAPWFGKRGASIIHVTLLSESGDSMKTPHGGEVARLQIVAEAHQDIVRPILGFYVRDKLGQRIFGDNTYLTYRDELITIPTGNKIMAEFVFRMPYLPPGDYSVSPAIAEGTQDHHVQHQWIDDALFFQVVASHVQKGLMGIPMLDIRLKLDNLTDATEDREPAQRDEVHS